jgi:formamidopyrimidine-DNA glycosylase
MPELADVEIYRQYFNATALHQDIEQTHVEDAVILADTTPQVLGRALKNNRFDATRRHGKHLFVELHNGGWLAMHFGMSGSLEYFAADKKVPDFTLLLVSFKNGHQLAYVAPRKLGHITLTDDPRIFIEAHHLGPDALALSPAEFRQLASGRRGSIKAWLMDQQTLAGIGNIYSDEILFQARIHPQTSVNKLNDATLDRLYRKIHRVFDTAIKAHADPAQMPDKFLLPHRDKGGRCPRCDGLLHRLSVSGRSAWFCPACQKKE